jgi:hypothetical protein
MFTQFARFFRSACRLATVGLLLARFAAQANAAVVSYNGPANGIDVPVAMTTDSRGNVIVTGYSATEAIQGAPFYDIVTIKYTPEGVQKWAFRFNEGVHDFPSAITVDENDNIYVTGRSWRSRWQGLNQYTYDWDYITIRYDAPRVLNHPQLGDILLEPTGYTWAVPYNAPLGADDTAVAIVNDPVNDWLFVTGTSYFAHINHPEIVTVRYDRRTGSEERVANYRRPVPFDAIGYSYAVAMGVDADGHVYVTGKAEGDGNRFDVVLIKYDGEDLIHAWWAGAVIYDAHGWDDEPVALKIHGSNIYIAGIARDDGNEAGNFLTLKYESDRDLAWSREFQVSNRLDRPNAMTVDSTGNVFVAGQYDTGNGNGTNLLVLGYRANGDGINWWTYAGVSPGSDAATAIGVDSSDRVYVAGYTWTGNLRGFDYVTMRLDLAGGFTWTQTYNNPENRADLAGPMAVTNSGMVYVAGKSYIQGQMENIVTVKYRWDGAVRW